MHKFYYIFIIVFSVALLNAGIINVPADYATIQAGIDSAQAGDTVLVAPDIYVENIDYHGKKLTVASNFIFSKNRSDILNTIIDGNSDSSVVSIEHSEPDGTMLTGFSIRNGLGTGDWPNVRGGGIHIKGSARPTIKHCIIHDNESIGSSNRGAGIYASSQFAYISNCEIFNNTSSGGGGIAIGNGASGTVVDSCNIYSNNTMTALMSNYSQFVVINRTIVHHNPGIGYRNYGTDSVTVMNSVFANNGDIGVINVANNSQIYLFNSFVGFNNGEQVVHDTSSTDNLIEAKYSNIIGGTDSLWFGTGCIDTIPQFSDTAGFDYSLLATSPMIDAGDPALPYDPDGTVADIGVHYFDQGSNSVEVKSLTPSNFELRQNYPNPFNPKTTIEFQIPNHEFISLNIYNVLGQHVTTLVSKELDPGIYKYNWDASSYTSGLYFYQLEVGGRIAETKKLVLIK